MQDGRNWMSARRALLLRGNEPVYGAGLSIELPLFDGFARRKKLRIAESELRGAEDELAHSRDSVIREVWKARTDFEPLFANRSPPQNW